jgi:hypothetical protein
MYKTRLELSSEVDPGCALLRLKAPSGGSGQVEFSISKVGGAENNLGVDGWQASEHWFQASRHESLSDEFFTVVVGPEIVRGLSLSNYVLGVRNAGETLVEKGLLVGGFAKAAAPMPISTSVSKSVLTDPDDAWPTPKPVPEPVRVQVLPQPQTRMAVAPSPTVQTDLLSAKSLNVYPYNRETWRLMIGYGFALFLSRVFLSFADRPGSESIETFYFSKFIFFTLLMLAGLLFGPFRGGITHAVCAVCILFLSTVASVELAFLIEYLVESASTVVPIGFLASPTGPIKLQNSPILKNWLACIIGGVFASFLLSIAMAAAGFHSPYWIFQNKVDLAVVTIATISALIAAVIAVQIKKRIA